MAEEKLPVSDAELSLEMLYEHIQEVKETTTKRLTEMQTQIDEMRKRMTNVDNKTTKRLVKITHIIDTTFDNFQQIMLTISDLTTRINECERKGMTVANSISINKRNLHDLSKYIKQVDKTWKEAIKEIDQLKDAMDGNVHINWKVAAVIVCGIVAIIFVLAGGDLIKLLETVRGFASGGN